MATQRSSLENIEDFLAQKRIAMVGISREQRDFSVMLFDELCRRGYEMVPVNPHTVEVRGRQCFASVLDIQPRVQAALLMTSPDVTEAVVRDCAGAGIDRVWMHQGSGQGALSAKALEFCHKSGIQVVAGECPFSCSCLKLELPIGCMA